MYIQVYDIFSEAPSVSQILWFYSHKTFWVRFSYSNSKIIQSKHCIYLKECFDWSIFEYEYKNRIQTLYDRKTRDILNVTWPDRQSKHCILSLSRQSVNFKFIYMSGYFKLSLFQGVHFQLIYIHIYYKYR